MTKRIVLTVLLGLLITTFAWAPPAHGGSPPPDLGAGLVAHYPFDGDATDASGNGHHGTLNGATFAADRDGNPNSALSLDGLDDFVQVSHHPDLNFNPTGFTAAFWLRASPDQFSFDSLFVPIDKSHGPGGWAVQGHTDPDVGGVGFLFCHDGADDCGPGDHSAAGVSPVSRVIDDEWHCMVGTFDPPALSFFLDGSLEGSTIPTGSPGANELDVFIGRWGLGARHLHGLMDDVRLYHRALTTGEIRAFCEANQPPDCSTVSADPKSLWPPNHKPRLVTLSGATDLDGDPVTLTVTGVKQDEPLNGLGDGDTAPDAQAGTQTNNVRLRAERSGTGNGRVYRVSFTGADGEGGSCSSTVTVGVPRNLGTGSTPIDSAPPSFDSFGP